MQPMCLPGCQTCSLLLGHLIGAFVEVLHAVNCPALHCPACPSSIDCAFDARYLPLSKNGASRSHSPFDFWTLIFFLRFGAAGFPALVCPPASCVHAWRPRRPRRCACCCSRPPLLRTAHAPIGSSQSSKGRRRRGKQLMIYCAPRSQTRHGHYTAACLLLRSVRPSLSSH